MKTPPGYEILEQLGDGGQGEVFKARQIHLDRMVALKTALPHASGKSLSHSLERLLREARTIAKFDHPNIVRVFDCFVFEDQIYIVMEFLDGQPLSRILEARAEEELDPFHRQMMKKPGVLREEWTLLIAVTIARGLEYAHGQRIYHRDIKPSNIFVTRTGEIKLFDFSIARDEQFKGLTATGVVIGSPPYMCPEQVKGELSDARSDIYSFGCVLYHCVTGNVPFDEPSEIMVCIAHMEKDPRSPVLVRPDVSPRLSGIVLRCMEKQKDARFQSALELEETLMTDFGESVEALSAKIYPRTSSSRISRISNERASVPPPIGPPEPAPKKSPNTLVITVCAVILLLAVIALPLRKRATTAPVANSDETKAIAEQPKVSPEEQARAESAARVAALETKLTEWVQNAPQDGSLVTQGVSIDKVEWAQAAPTSIQLEATNANAFPVEVSYFVSEASLTYGGIDTADSWKPVTGSLNFGGNGFGSALGTGAIFVQPHESAKLDLLPKDVAKLPAAIFARSVKLDGLHFAATASSESITKGEIPDPPAGTLASVTLPGMPPSTEALPKSLADDPLLQKALEDAFNVPLPSGDSAEDKLLFFSRHESAENLLKFLQRGQNAADGGRILDPSLIQVRDVQVDPLTGAVDLILEIDSSGHDVEVSAFVARGDQRLVLARGQTSKTVTRPLRGLVTEPQKFRAPDFRTQKRLPLADLFRKNADPGALTFQSSEEIRIDRLLVLCVYTHDSKPAGLSPQSLGYKVVTGIRTTR